MKFIAEYAFYGIVDSSMKFVEHSFVKSGNFYSVNHENPLDIYNMSKKYFKKTGYELYFVHSHPPLCNFFSELDCRTHMAFFDLIFPMTVKMQIVLPNTVLTQTIQKNMNGITFNVKRDETVSGENKDLYDEIKLKSYGSVFETIWSYIKKNKYHISLKDICARIYIPN